jgi:hypothetical protein
MNTIKENSWKLMQYFGRTGRKINYAIKNYLIKYGIITVIMLLCISIILANLLWSDKDISIGAITLASVCLMIITLFKSTYSQEENTQKQIDSFKDNTRQQIEQFEKSTDKQIETTNILQKVSEKFDTQIEIQKKIIDELKQVVDSQKKTTDIQRETVDILREVSKKSDEQIEVQKGIIDGLIQVSESQKESTKTQKEAIDVLKEVSRKSDAQIDGLTQVADLQKTTSSWQIDRLEKICEFEKEILFYAIEQLQKMELAKEGNNEMVKQLKINNEKLDINKPIIAHLKETGKNIGEGFKEISQDIKKWWKNLWD